MKIMFCALTILCNKGLCLVSALRKKIPYLPINYLAVHLCVSGGHARFPGHKHLLNTMLELHWFL